VDGDADQAKRQQEQPHDWIEYQRQQCHRPAHDEEKTPEQKGNHRYTPSEYDTQSEPEKFDDTRLVPKN
jgi:hypothetical protein